MCGGDRAVDDHGASGFHVLQQPFWTLKNVQILLVVEDHRKDDRALVSDRSDALRDLRPLLLQFLQRIGPLVEYNDIEALFEQVDAHSESDIPCTDNSNLPFHHGPPFRADVERIP